MVTKKYLIITLITLIQTADYCSSLASSSNQTSQTITQHDPHNKDGVALVRACLNMHRHKVIKDTITKQPLIDINAEYCYGCEPLTAGCPVRNGTCDWGAIHNHAHKVISPLNMLLNNINGLLKMKFIDSYETTIKDALKLFLESDTKIGLKVENSAAQLLLLLCQSHDYRTVLYEIYELLIKYETSRKDDVSDVVLSEAEKTKQQLENEIKKSKININEHIKYMSFYKCPSIREANMGTLTYHLTLYNERSNKLAALTKELVKLKNRRQTQQPN